MLNLFLNELYKAKENRIKVKFSITDRDKTSQCHFIPDSIEYDGTLVIVFNSSQYIRIRDVENYTITLDSNGCNSYSLSDRNKGIQMVFIF